MRRKRYYWFVPEITLFVASLLFLVVAVLISVIAYFVDSITPESVKISRQIEHNRRDSLATLWLEERKVKRLEEDRRAEEDRNKKHLLYVVARFDKKDSTSRRFIVLNTSRADIDSGRAIVFAHRWDEKSLSSKRTADTTEIMLRPIPSGKRDTLVVPQYAVSQRDRKAMRYAIDSVALVGIVFR
jgi:lipopolysaccharide export LptBFGC system permease protein LptF